MTLPLASPEVEILPFMVDWGNGTNHPTNLLQQECKLLSISGTHPSPKEGQEVLKKLGTDFELTQGDQIALRATIESPNRIVQI